MTRITKEPIWFNTGNPFVDMGQEIMAALAGVDEVRELTKQHVEPLLQRLTEIYTQGDWVKSLQKIFPNSKLVNAQIKDHRTAYLQQLEQWFDMLTSSEDLSLPCAISGKRAHVLISRTYFPMSDGENRNFQSANSKGIPINAAVALALQFFPLALVKIGGMMALPHFSDPRVTFEWANDSLNCLLDNETIGAGAIRDAGSSRKINAFFKLIEELVRDNEDINNSSVTLYVFDNYNQIGYQKALEIYYLPARVFTFIRLAMTQSVRREWRSVVRRGYTYLRNDTDDEQILKHSNLVYSNLLTSKSISRFFISINNHVPTVRGFAGWKLYETYLMEVQRMDERRIDSLKDLADHIAPLIRKRKKRLLRLERSSSRAELTGILYRLTKDAAAAGAKSPLITFDQLVGDVFPHDMQYSDWREVKYLLLFRVYEQLFDELKDDPDLIANNEDPEEGQDD